ncbi:hypothetical protein PCANC_22200 [Puccinia coronata f. sp. avenae]|uniref:Protein BFR2 n=1 Tax=Puccinia coronata f. sp. avenae TaxID=200324 RepID=A0A2N5SJN7_9BASI|nr:hypothetical protein PCASD_23333 [Puccinia coronata f. sp. avenae]PLW13421.1 hypothetical protein PCANC_22200 [Puccinia coronata f. sp. avenae]
MSSLASLFKKISQQNPAEIDPEDGYHSLDAKAKQSTGSEHDEDFTKIMGASKLRQQKGADNDCIQHTKYAGRLVSVKDWMDPDTDDLSGSEHPKNRTRRDLKQKRKTEYEGEEEQDNEEEVEGEEGLDEYGNDDDDEGEDEDDDGGEEEEEEEEDDDDNDENEDGMDDENSDHGSSTSLSGNQESEKRTRKKTHPKSSTSHSQVAQEEPSDLIQHLQSSVKADIEKGKAVKKQLTTYDRILAIRIALQKPLISTNQLVEMKHQREKDADTNDDNEREQARIAVQNLLDISSKLGTLRSELMQSIDGEPPRKRKKDHHETDDDLTNALGDCIEQAEQLDKRLAPYLRTTVRKWSTKINSTTALNSKKFDAGSKQQNVMDQLDQIWTSKDERDKLISRSRTNKKSANRATLAPKNSSSDDPAVAQIFEDRDFYLSLLKEVVETATRNQEETMMGMNDYRSQRTRRGDVDPKASKGRKIRYDVHEKLVSLMVPIQNELWTEEQKDELFGSLFGFGFEPNAPSTHHDQPFALAKADGFKLF